MRNFDIGLDDGQVTPCLLPCVSACEGAEACPRPVPTLDGLSRSGFSATVLIEPRVWEANKIFTALYGEYRPAARRLDPTTHFAPLIHHIRQVASSRHYRDADHAGFAVGAADLVTP
jgi:hypothetical protein